MKPSHNETKETGERLRTIAALMDQRDELAAALRSLADFAENHIRLNIKGKHLALAAGQCEELAERARAALAKLGQS